MSKRSAGPAAALSSHTAEGSPASVRKRRATAFECVSSVINDSCNDLGSSGFRRIGDECTVAAVSSTIGATTTRKRRRERHALG
jgi:hypothetical protein